MQLVKLGAGSTPATTTAASTPTSGTGCGQALAEAVVEAGEVLELLGKGVDDTLRLDHPFVRPAWQQRMDGMTAVR